MLFKSVIALSFALSGLAAPSSLHRRGADEVNAALGMVKTSLDSLDVSVKGIRNSTDTKSIGQVATKADALGKTLMKAQTMIKNTDKVDLFDATSVSDSADALTASLKATTGDLVKKKPIIKQAGLDGVVAQMLVMQKQQSAGLSNAVKEKLPALAAPFAGTTAKNINDALDSAIKAYMSNSTTPNAAGSSPKAVGSAAPAASSSSSNSTATANGRGTNASSARGAGATGSTSTSGKIIDLHGRGVKLPLW